MPTNPLPRVRVVVLNYDGGDMTMRCMESLRALDYPVDRLELVMVDNASIDGVVDRVKAERPDVRVVESFVNRGFGGGCNLGIGDPAAGEYDHVALINNDAMAEPGWLRPLVDALEADPGLGAAASKMLFAERAWSVALDVEPTFTSRTNPFYRGVALSGVRIDDENRWHDVGFDEGYWGTALDPLLDMDVNWSKAHGEVRIGDRQVDAEHPPRSMSLRLHAPAPMRVTLSSGAETQTVTVGITPDWHTIALPAGPDDIVNNAGSCLFQDGSAGDRGFLERDLGQFDEPDEVFAWCGGAVLLRADYLADVGTFDERFFLYYEDTDLSWRGRRKGWRYQYVPDSVVRHEHAASSGGAESPFFRFNVDRNRLITLAKHAPDRMLVEAVRRQSRAMVRLLAYEAARSAKHRRPMWGKGRQQFESMRSAARLWKELRVERAALAASSRIDDADVMGWTVTK
jgi:GT2 family glycosyltransferase